MVEKEVKNKVFGKRRREITFMSDEKLQGMFEGNIEKLKTVLKKWESQKIRQILRFNEWYLFCAVINYLDFDSFMYLVGFLSSEEKKEMAFTREGMIFETMITNNCGQELMGEENISDFTEKAKFFLEIAKNYFTKLFFANEFIRNCPKIKKNF